MQPKLVRARLQHVVSTSPGTGVDVAPIIPPEPQRSCGKGDGRRGVAPGRIRGTNGASYALTCAHVVDKDCDCALWPPQHLSKHYSGTDAVLLCPGSCFHAHDGGGRAYTAAAKEEWGRPGRKPVLRLGPSRGNRHGYLKALLRDFDDENGYRCEMHSLWIVPRRLRYGVFPAHPFKPGFSRRGDSGDWVVGGEANETWMGMIVEGSRSGTIAHYAPFLMEYFERELHDRRISEGPLTGVSYGAS